MHRSRFEPELSAGIDEITIDDNPRVLAEPHARLLAEMNEQTRRGTSADEVRHEYR
jgi:hypothetical protein